MLKLNNLGAPRGANKDTKRRGRGPGSGQGKTAGRGHKGQKARSGKKIKPWFEGGQMPLQRRLPKRGFTNIFKREFQIVNLEDLDAFTAGDVVDAPALQAAGLIRHADRPVKLLARGAVDRALQVKVTRASEAAVAAVTAAGGTVTCED
jgi:large subunit ribosomal protein L15